MVKGTRSSQSEQTLTGHGIGVLVLAELTD